MERCDFLPVSAEEMHERGWWWYDALVVGGDAYVDHPSFGTAVISRVLEAEGLRVAVLAQPDWHDAEAFRAMGRPRLGVFIGAGNLDSMVAHYTAAKRRRSEDFYSPGKRTGEPAPLRTLRLLGRRRPPRHPLRRPGRPAGLRHGRGRDDRDRPPPEEKAVRAHDDGHPRHRLHHARPRRVQVRAHHAPVVRGRARRQAPLCRGHTHRVRRARPHPRPRYAPAVRGALSGHQPARHAARHEGARPCGRAALYPRVAPHVRAARRRARDRGGALQRDPQPRLLRRVQFLRAGVPPGPHDYEPQPRERHPRGRGHDAPPALEGVRIRRRRPVGKLPPPVVPPAAGARHVPEPAVPRADALPEHRCRPLRLSHPAAQAAPDPRRKEGVRAQRHPLRLYALRRQRRVLPRARALPHLRSAQGRARALHRHRARLHGQAPHRHV